MTENRGYSTPPPRTAAPVTPFNGNSTTPPPAVTAPPLPNPDIMTQEMIRASVTEIAFLLKNPDMLADDPGTAMRHFRQLTRAAVGDAAYHKLYKNAVTDIIEKGGGAGTEMIENVQRHVDDHFRARNDMITSVRNAHIFGTDEKKFRENYAIVGVILDEAIQKYGQTLHANHTQTKDQFVEDLGDILHGTTSPQPRSVFSRLFLR